ncbi:MAG: AEC family transporter [Haloarculaceae archaeon]
MSLSSVLVSAVLPVVAVAGVGVVLGRYRGVAVEPLSEITIYVLAPALVFHSLLTTPIGGGTVVRLFAGVALFTVVLVVLAEGLGRALGENEPVLGAFVLTSTFSNAGNYGIPLSAFAFGALERSTAVLFIAAQSVLMYTLGVYVASRGQDGSSLAALRRVLRLPLVYAVAGALAVRWLGFVPPTGSTLMRTLQLTGDASIPVMLLMLGIQLATSTSAETVRRVLPATGTKLLVAPVLAVGVAVALGLSGTVGKVFVLECATPAAVTPLMLTIEFGDPDRPGETLSAADYVSATILVSTLASLVTVTALVVVLRSGIGL